MHNHFTRFKRRAAEQQQELVELIECPTRRRVTEQQELLSKVLAGLAHFNRVIQHDKAELQVARQKLNTMKKRKKGALPASLAAHNRYISRIEREITRMLGRQEERKDMVQDIRAKLNANLRVLNNGRRKVPGANIQFKDMPMDVLQHIVQFLPSINVPKLAMSGRMGRLAVQRNSNEIRVMHDTLVSHTIDALQNKTTRPFKIGGDTYQYITEGEAPYISYILQIKENGTFYNLVHIRPFTTYWFGSKINTSIRDSDYSRILVRAIRKAMKLVGV